MYIKTKIRRCFSRAKLTYDLHAELQQNICQQLIALLNSRNYHYARIIDIGCGTGLSTQFLKNAFPANNLIAIDLAEDLLAITHQRVADTVTICADFDHIPILNQQFDLVFSNMALQWSLNLSETLSEISRMTQNAGLLACSLPVSGTFSELKQLLFQLTGKTYFNEFIALPDLSAALNQSGYQILNMKTTDHYFTYPDLKTAFQSFKKIGALANGSCRSLTKSLYQKILPVSPRLNYCIVQFLAQKIQANQNV